MDKKRTVGTIAAIGHQIGLKKAWGSIIPVGKGTHRDLALEQCPGLRRCYAMWLPVRPGAMEQPIGSGWAEREELCT
ncbi:MAG: hypothetical protein M3R61_02145, partial [Chloroflexota bacterium]|nr:hypothetical protein [Chloroflexota bacterium]